MKQTKHLKIVIAVFSLIFAVSFAFGMFSVYLRQNNGIVKAETTAQTPVFSEIGLEGKSFVKGSQITIPVVKMTLNNKQYDTVSILHKPDGSAQYANGTTKLSSIGKYSVEYKATVENKTYSTSESITVYQPKFELSDGAGQAEYSTENISGLEGELISLEKEQTVTIRDYFDITKATASEPIFEACIIPNKKGTADFLTLTIKFISKKDPSSYLEVVANYYDYNNCTYFLAGANNQTVTGYESSQGTIHVGNTWGAPISGSFTLTPNNNMSIKDDTLKIYLDYETKIVYANTGKVFVVDLDDPKYFGSLWEGFSDGEVYVEISANRYETSNLAQILLMKCGDIDLTQQNTYDIEAPEIAVDFGDYAETNLPIGKSGLEYPIFTAHAEDYFSGDCEVTERVWARYYTSQKYELEIKDGKFLPSEAGIYIIEYRAIDDSGNEAVRRVEIEIVDDLNDMTISLTNQQTTGKTGEYISFADVSVVGGSGNVTVDLQVSLNGESVDCMPNGFWAKKAGNYVVSITATDYIGEIKSESYVVTITENDLPVFLDAIYMPKYLIAGSTYSFGAVYAYDYTSGKTGDRVKAVLYTEDANGVKEHSDGCYTPSVRNHLDTVKVYYKAGINGKTAQSEVFEIKVCVVGNGKNIEISKYFVSDDVSIQATSNGMILSTTKDKATVDFANPVLANGLTYTFNVDPSQNSFSRLNVYLRDSINEKECIKIGYSKSSQNASYISLNDGAQYSIPASFFGGSSHEFAIKFDNKICVASYETEVKINVGKTIYGEPFAGFSSGKAYVAFEFDGVVSGGTIVVSEIGGQQTTSVKADLIKPKIDLTNEISGRYSLGDVVDLTTAVALDVLDPNISSYYTVYTPDGSIATDINGKVLQNIALNESYRIKLDSYGNYRVSFVAEDWNGRKEKSFSYVMEVVDIVPPVITLNGTVPSEANVGDVIDIPLAKAIDIIDGVRSVYAFIYSPDGRYRAYENGMAFNKAGKYKVVYYAFDESGNTAKLVYTINVK